jgi:phosphatidylserine/phosphatidylglycerophosphate/cardiolipin synthase-like enzyme
MKALNLRIVFSVLMALGCLQLALYTSDAQARRKKDQDPVVVVPVFPFWPVLPGFPIDPKIDPTTDPSNQDPANQDPPQQPAPVQPQVQPLGASGVLPDASTAPAINLTFVTPQNGFQPWIDVIQRASTSIQMEMYHLTEPTVIAALVAAQGRGVNVQIILDRSSLSGGKYDTVTNQLTSAGITWRPSSPAFSITHSKFLVADSSTAVITSMNLTRDFATTRDYGVVTQDLATVAQVLLVFTSDWANYQNTSPVTPALTDGWMAFSPVNSTDRLTAVIQTAQSSLDVTVENLGSDDINKALIAAAGRGVAIRVIVPMCDENPNPLYNYPSLQTLASSGIQTHVMPYPADANHPYMHGKMIIADQTDAYIGSINYSMNSLQKARETGIIINQLDSITFLSQTFEGDWNASVTIPSPLPTNCPHF